jgi:transposase InsO family protein
VKYAWIEGHSHSQSIARLCRVLGVSRTGFLQWRIREPSERDQANHALDARVAIIHAESKRSYGRIRITRRLHQQGIAVGHERVRKSLCRQHLRSVYRRKYRVTTDSAHSKPVAANLLARRFDGWSLNRAWTADITYLATDEGWLYLAAILDLATRRLVGWAMSERIDAKIVCDALQMAYWRRRPDANLLMHSDRGVQYASHEYRELLKQFKMTQSMSRKANCWDNAPMESFFKSLKVERIYQLRYTSRAQARLDVVNWIEGFYNLERLHSTIDYQSPVDLENSLQATQV